MDSVARRTYNRRHQFVMPLRFPSSSERGTHGTLDFASWIHVWGSCLQRCLSCIPIHLQLSSSVQNHLPRPLNHGLWRTLTSKQRAALPDNPETVLHPGCVWTDGHTSFVALGIFLYLGIFLKQQYLHMLATWCLLGPSYVLKKISSTTELRTHLQSAPSAASRLGLCPNNHIYLWHFHL